MHVCQLQMNENTNLPSFQNAQQVRHLIECLPEVPRWNHREIGAIAPYTTKAPMMLYYRDALEVVAHLFSNPVFGTCMEMEPYKLWDDTDDIPAQVYGDFMSGTFAWQYQASEKIITNVSDPDIFCPTGKYSTRKLLRWYHAGVR